MKIAQIGETILSETATPINPSEFGSSSLRTFVDELMGTMLEAKGIGIAAPQVFDPRAIMILASRPNARYPDAPTMAPTVLINPEIISQSEEQVMAWEGCLSVPGLRGNIARADWVDVRYNTIEGEQIERRFEGFVARVFLHEFDHLIGKTWLDQVEDTSQIMAETVWLARYA